MPTDTWTLAKVLDWTIDYFQSKGFETPRLDAEILIAEALGTDRVGLYLHHHKPLNDTELSVIRGYVKRRASSEPVAYIVGKRGFWNLELKVDARALVPRPETEHLVEKALGFLKDFASPDVLDVGCGTGCVALSIASEVESARVLGVDISEAALALSRENAELIGCENVTWRHSDLLASVSEHFDLVVSNPPYIRSGEISSLMDDVKVHEPHSALDGGADGLDIYRRLVPEAVDRLNPGGCLMVEIGYDQASDVGQIFTESGLINIDCLQDYAGLDRVISGHLIGG